MRLRVAAATANRSFRAGSARPSADESAAACTGGNASRLPSSGRQISTSPENSSCASDSYPVARSTSIDSRALDRVAQQGGLAHAGLAAQHDRVARSRTGSPEQALDPLDLRSRP